MPSSVPVVKGRGGSGVRAQAGAGPTLMREDAPRAPVHDFAKARRRWARTDPTLARVAREGGAVSPELATDVGAFEALVSSIAHQQVSIQAGRSIFARVREAAGGGALTPEGVLRAGPERLRAAGLSRPKVAYALDLAERAAGGSLDLAALADATDEEVVEALTQVKGIGVWTAKMFLIFHMARPDVLPHEDLGLQVAVAEAYGVPRAKAAAKMQRLQPQWSPWCSLASLTLWNWRRVQMAAEKKPASG